MFISPFSCFLTALGGFWMPDPISSFAGLLGVSEES